jgi:hypothetical protein
MPFSRPYQSVDGIVAHERPPRQCQPSRKQRDKCHPESAETSELLRGRLQPHGRWEIDGERMALEQQPSRNVVMKSEGGLLQNPNSCTFSTIVGFTLDL